MSLVTTILNRQPFYLVGLHYHHWPNLVLIGHMVRYSSQLNFQKLRDDKFCFIGLRDLKLMSQDPPSHTEYMPISLPLWIYCHFESIKKHLKSFSSFSVCSITHETWRTTSTDQSLLNCMNNVATQKNWHGWNHTASDDIAWHCSCLPQFVTCGYIFCFWHTVFLKCCPESNFVCCAISVQFE